LKRQFGTYTTINPFIQNLEVYYSTTNQITDQYRCVDKLETLKNKKSELEAQFEEYKNNSNLSNMQFIDSISKLLVPIQELKSSQFVVTMEITSIITVFDRVGDEVSSLLLPTSISNSSISSQSTFTVLDIESDMEIDREEHLHDTYPSITIDSNTSTAITIPTSVTSLLLSQSSLNTTTTITTVSSSLSSQQGMRSISIIPKPNPNPNNNILNQCVLTLYRIATTAINTTC
jgi:hypothetical protein